MSSWLSQVGLLIHSLVFPGIRMNCSHVVHTVMAVPLISFTLQSCSSVISAAYTLDKMPAARLVPHIWALQCSSLLPRRIFISSLSHSA